MKYDGNSCFLLLSFQKIVINIMRLIPEQFVFFQRVNESLYFYKCPAMYSSLYYLEAPQKYQFNFQLLVVNS